MDTKYPEEGDRPYVKVRPSKNLIQSLITHLSRQNLPPRLRALQQKKPQGKPEVPEVIFRKKLIKLIMNL